MVMGPLAEQRPADADDRRALLDRDLEVVAHAHRQLRPEAPASARAAARTSSRKRDERRAGLLGSVDRRPIVIRPRTSRRGRSTARLEHRRSRSRRARSPAFAGSSSTLTWRRTGQRAARAHLGGEPVEPPARSIESTVWIVVERSRAPAAPCSTGAARPGASVAPGHVRRPWPRPPGRGSRRAS